MIVLSLRVVLSDQHKPLKMFFHHFTDPTWQFFVIFWHFFGSRKWLCKLLVTSEIPNQCNYKKLQNQIFFIFAIKTKVLFLSPSIKAWLVKNSLYYILPHYFVYFLNIINLKITFCNFGFIETWPECHVSIQKIAICEESIVLYKKKWK